MTATNGNAHVNGNGVVNGTTANVPLDASAIAISANTPDLVPDLLAKIAASGKSFAANDFKARTELLDAATALVRAVETPREAMIRIAWSQSTLYACIQVGIDLGLFTALSKDDKPKTASELAEAVRADSKLVARILKHLNAMGAIHETGPDTYSRTGFSTSLTLENFSNSYPCMTLCITDGIMALPELLKKNGYRTPSNGSDCGFQIGYKTDLHFFEWLKSHPLAAKQFNDHMSAYHQGRPSWMDAGFYDVPQLIQGVEDVLLVDMGGSLGHDLGEFRRKWPDAPGRLVLQDLPEVVEGAKAASLDPSIELQAHDFFTEQPIKGARAYYMHSILHDWTNENALKILKNIVPAMKPGYSKVLINENVIPATNAYWETTSLDIIMMSDFASTERTAGDWQELVEAAGLKIVKIWTAQRGVESLIECELA